jgi:uncharacterized protein with NRDE domain
MTTAVTTYTVAAILIVCLLVMAAMTIAVYRLIAVQNGDDDDLVTVPDVNATVWDHTVAALGHPDDIDTTMPMPAWPGTEVSK